MSNIVPFEQQITLAESFVRSGLFGLKTKEQALALMALCEAEGVHPAIAVRDFHVIQGRPALKADAMLARFQKEGGVVEWDTYTDTKVSGRFSHPKSSPKPVLIEWTIEQAKRIGLANRDNWKNYPRAMMRARVISEGVRTVYPGIAVGIYTVEETQDFEPRIEKNITPTSGAKDRVEPSKANEIDELAKKVQEFADAGQYEDAVLTVENEALDADQMTYLWTQFDAPTRKQLKAASKALKEKYAAQVVETPKEKTITEAQRKRLEARISELKLNRDDIKLKCKEDYGREHFSELTQSEYEVISKYVDDSDDFIKGLDSDPKNVL